MRFPTKQIYLHGKGFLQKQIDLESGND